MTRSLIDNMVNSIQEEMMSRQRERNERSLVNEAVLMAIQRHGLQHQQDEDQDETSSSVQSPPGVIQSKSDSADQNKVDSHSSGSLHNTPTTSPNPAIHTSRTSEQAARLPVQTGHRGSNESTVAPICKTENSNNEDRLRSESSVNSVQNTSETAVDPDKNSECRRSSEENARISDQYGRISERGPSIGNEFGINSEGNPSISDQYGRFSEENPSINDQYGRFSEENPGISDQYGGISEGGPSICDDFGRSSGDSRLNEDDDFLTQAVSVAISKKGLSA
ncbi:dentin sialophosphoprotein-like [Diaphorina citri]|uniref:Dentin sialophosphoprotein-like n=1 Tax=Diaphorina citri TaxID=121845 RepID=A0A1S4EIF2_DIACI|nr:dentin sialophosphoprotein-like [Diaphorina citri]